MSARVEYLFPGLAESLGLDIDALDGVLEDEFAVLADAELDDSVVARNDMVELSSDLLHVLRDSATKFVDGLPHVVHKMA